MIAIVGPTASGKTHKAVALAKRIGGEIISADSRQLYRGMDIGTGKDLEEYGTVPYHLIDICPAGYKYNLYEYLRDCDKAVAEIRQRGNQPIVCGGTGLYVESYLKGVRLPEVPYLYHLLIYYMVPLFSSYLVFYIEHLYHVDQTLPLVHI